MARKKKNVTKKSHRVAGSAEKNKLMAGGFETMTFADCRRRAICLGMPFPDVLNADHGGLQSFILKAEAKPDPSLIDKYDDWMDKQLEDLGYPKDDPMRSYYLRLGYVGEEKVGERVKTKRVKGIPKPKKKKREKTKEGLWVGTKKSYTYDLTYKGLPIERVKRKVLKKFPEANEKSIQQWYRKALKEKGIDYKKYKPNLQPI